MDRYFIENLYVFEIYKKVFKCIYDKRNVNQNYMDIVF